MGGVAAVQKKIASFAHTEFKAAAGDPEEIRRIIMSGRGFFGFGDRYMPEPLTHGFPPFLADGKCRFPDMILPADETAWRKAALKRSWFRAAKNLHTMLVDCDPDDAGIPASVHEEVAQTVWLVDGAPPFFSLSYLSASPGLPPALYFSISLSRWLFSRA